MKSRLFMPFVLSTLIIVGGAGTSVLDAATPVFINEIHYDNTGTDAGEAIEIAGPAGTDLTGWSIIRYNGANGLVYTTPEADPSGADTLSGAIPDLDSGFGVVIINYTENGLQNGAPDGLALVDSSNNVIQFLSYEGTFTAVDGPATGMTSTDIGVSENGSGLVGNSLQLTGSGTVYDDFHWAAEAPNTFGSVNTGQSFGTAPPPSGMCGDAFTPIYAVQGDGLASSMVGMNVSIEGVVVGDFQNNASTDNGDLSGFYVQDPAGDGDPATSDGIFVFAPGSIDVAVGDALRVRGTVSEFNGMTEISAVSAVLQCSTGNPLPTPAIVTLPVAKVDDFEAYEGMLVTLPQTLYISEYFNFDRFGEIVLTTERQYQPTAIYEPGAYEAAQLAVDNQLSRITLDDGRTTSNPDPAIHPNGNVFDLTNLFRGGDTVQNVTGVMAYAFGLYRIQPTQGADYTNANLRTTQPDDVGGNLKVASFNVLNYFTTIDDSGPICGPASDQDCRGADDATEFTRQRDKIIAAMSTINADVFGLIEIENYPGDVPVADLVSGLNDVLGSGTYDYIATGAMGSGAIRVALIYRPATVTPIGNYAVLNSSVDSRFLDTLNRPVLAQSFMDNSAGGIFTVAVNHLKSKGSSCDAVGDPDTGDGAGNCNQTRKAAAEALVDWLATDPTGSGNTDFLIMGDLNSYDKEDPIDAIRAGADDTLGTGDDYTDLVHDFLGENAYSYVFDGQLGYLDYALASSSLVNEVNGVTFWHINADEPDLIDYDTTFKGPNQIAIYAPDGFRSSDHDPVIIGLNTCDEIPPTLTVSVTPDVLWAANHNYVDVTATVVVSDNFDPSPTITLVSVDSDEPDNGLGDGDTANDIVIVDDLHFMLRAERSALGDGRTYTINYEATDACGNSTSKSATVSVPHNQ